MFVFMYGEIKILDTMHQVSRNSAPIVDVLNE